MLFILLLDFDALSVTVGLLCFAVIGIPAYMLWHNHKEKIKLRRLLLEQQEQLEQAKRAYKDALQDLKQNPTNPDLKQKTLNLGRQYSARCRENKAATIYDEVAIMNDISAATAAIPQTVQPQSQPSIEDRLAKLSDLKNKGLINDSEYQQRRQKLLDEV